MSHSCLVLVPKFFLISTKKIDRTVARRIKISWLHFLIPPLPQYISNEAVYNKALTSKGSNNTGTCVVSNNISIMILYVLSVF